MLPTPSAPTESSCRLRPSEALLAGERNGIKIEGYDLGNSPCDMTPSLVGGRIMVFDSTNGTKLARQFESFSHVAFGSLVSLTASVAFVREIGGDPIVACAGRLGDFSAEDALASGYLISKFMTGDCELNDAASFAVRLVEKSGELWRSWAGDSFHGRYLKSIGFEADVDFCLTIDRFGFVPVKREDKFVRGN